MKLGIIAATVAAIGAAGIASANPIRIDDQSSNNFIGSAGLVLNPYDFSAEVFGGALPGNFTNDALSYMHQQLNAPGGNASNGITTEGFVTVVAGFANNNGNTELSLFTLIDREGVNQNVSGGLENFLQFSSTLDTPNTSGVSWINDAGDTDFVVNPSSGGFQALAASFNWDDTNAKGDGFAWSNLARNDGGDLRFGGQESDNFGSGEAMKIQFASWNGTSWDTTIIDGLDLTALENAVGFDFVVIPLPPAAFIGLLGLAGVGVMRRRMSA
jgi:hypothetical protein